MVETTPMAEPSPLFKTLAIEPDPPAAPPPPQQNAHEHAVAIQMIRMALSAVWQQFVIALAHLFTLASAASVFALYFVTADPNTHQLIMLGGYSLFVLCANWLVIGSRRK
jgi:hypothetical protein